MPITKSAAKAMRQNIMHRRRNIHLKDVIKTEVKALQQAIAASNTKEISERLNAAQSKLDKAAKNGVIHANKAAREKSKLAKLASTAAKSASRRTAAKPVAKAPETASKSAEPKAEAKPAK